VLTSLGPSTVVETVAQSLQEEILSGRLAPGSFLRQRAVAAHFGVSEGAVREAFRRLEARGLLESRRRRGVRVSPLFVAELQDLYELRSVRALRLHPNDDVAVVLEPGQGGTWQCSGTTRWCS